MYYNIYDLNLQRWSDRARAFICLTIPSNEVECIATPYQRSLIPCIEELGAMLMRRRTFKTLIEFLIMIAMLFGWIAMLSVGFRNVILEHSEGSEPSEASRFNPLRYGFQIFLVATLAFAFLSRRRILNERLSLGIIIFGLFSLCQPFTIVLYRCGFQTLLVGTLAFIIISHMK